MHPIPGIIKFLLANGPVFVKKKAEKSLFFHKLCLEFEIDYQNDDFNFLYLRSLAILIQEYPTDWAIIFKMPESRKIFQECHQKNDYTVFERHLDAQLHVNDDLRKTKLKPMDQLPDGLVSGFCELYKEQIGKSMPPVLSELNSKLSRIISESQTSNGERQHDPNDQAITAPPLIPLSPRVKKTLAKIRNFYTKDDVEEALDVAEQFMNTNRKDGINRKILGHILNCNMRLGKYASIRQVIDSVKAYAYYPEFSTLFQIRLFESELRESYNLLPDRDAFYKRISEAETLLEQIPNRFKDTDYYYWCGRCAMELWWAYQSENESHLDNAIKRLKKADKGQWWVECYICMVLKLLGEDEEFNVRAEHHLDTMFKIYQDDQERAACKIHLINALVLTDDRTHQLKEYLEKLKKPTSSNDLNGSLRHYIDVIYCNDEQKREKYQKLIKSWK